jgi:NAD(P)-dependent dehydrogenase (short-subunit alcohol dehydrogenase family)
MTKPGKQIVITGGNAGIGYEIAKSLARGGHKVNIIVRNKKKGEESVNRIRNECNGAEISYTFADLTNFDSIRAAAAELNQKWGRIDVLIHNAGTFYSKRQKNSEGVELTFMVNHVAPFYLTHLLLPSLIRKGESRIINVNSDSHYQAKFEAENLQLDHHYTGLKAYARSKLANVLFTYEFDRMNPFDQLSIFAVHPGLVKTDIGKKHTYWLHGLIWKVFSRNGLSPAQGADTPAYLALADSEELISGRYWKLRKIKKSSKASYDLESARTLWEKTMEICGLETYFETSD